MLAINKRKPVTGLFVHGTMIKGYLQESGGCFSVLKKCCVYSKHKQRRKIKRHPLLVPTTFLEALFFQVKGGTGIWRVRREVSCIEGNRASGIWFPS